VKFGKLKSLVGAIAPTIGASLGGPLGGTAGKVIADVLGCKPTPEEIGKAMQSATPEQLAEIKKAEIAYKERMAELEVDVFELENQDRQDARSRFASDYTSRILAIAMTFGFLAYIYIVTIDPEGHPMELVNLILGYLAAQISQISSFYWGGSHEPKND